MTPAQPGLPLDALECCSDMLHHIQVRNTGDR
jgi:hypothetical protein